jgi:hypothetical protein
VVGLIPRLVAVTVVLLLILPWLLVRWVSFAVELTVRSRNCCKGRSALIEWDIPGRVDWSWFIDHVGVSWCSRFWDYA